MSWQTAISRKKPSVPAKWLFENGYLTGTLLDYGCGRGTDADHYGMDKYDPHWFPNKPVSWYDTITCAYVLNVIPKDAQNDVIRVVRRLLSENGSAYFTVRRDIAEPTPGKGCIQVPVYLDLPVLRQTSSFCIYRMNKT